jgi:hypothetical protein
MISSEEKGHESPGDACCHIPVSAWRSSTRSQKERSRFQIGKIEIEIKIKIKERRSTPAEDVPLFRSLLL